MPVGTVEPVNLRAKSFLCGSKLDEILSLPRYRENWSGSDSIPNKGDLPRPHNVRFLLSACHNKLYGRGMENEDFDLAKHLAKNLANIKIEENESKNLIK